MEDLPQESKKRPTSDSQIKPLLCWLKKSWPGEKEVPQLLNNSLVLLDFDEDKWEQKIVKIYKALAVMEKVKYLDPHFSKAFSDLANFIHFSRKSGQGEQSQFSGMTGMTGFSMAEQQFMFQNSFLKKKDSNQLNETFSNYNYQINQSFDSRFDQSFNGKSSPTQVIPQPYQNQINRNYNQQPIHKSALPNALLMQNQQKASRKQSSRSLSLKNEEIEEQPEEQIQSPQPRKNPINTQALYELSHDKKSIQPSQSISFDPKHQELTQLLNSQKEQKVPPMNLMNVRQSLPSHIQMQYISQMNNSQTQNSGKQLQSNMSNVSGPRSISQITYIPSVSDTPHSRSKMVRLKRYEGLNQSTIQNIKQELISDQFAQRQNSNSRQSKMNLVNTSLPQIRQTYHQASKKDKGNVTMYKTNKNIHNRNNSNSNSGSKRRPQAVAQKSSKILKFEAPDPNINKPFIIDQGMIEEAFAKQNRISKEPLQTIPEKPFYQMNSQIQRQQTGELSENSRNSNEDYNPYIYKKNIAKLPTMSLQQPPKIDQALSESSNQLILAASPASNQLFPQQRSAQGQSHPVNYNSDYKQKPKEGNAFAMERKQSVTYDSSDSRAYANFEEMEEQENIEQKRRMCSTSFNYNRKQQTNQRS